MAHSINVRDIQQAYIVANNALERSGSIYRIELSKDVVGHIVYLTRKDTVTGSVQKTLIYGATKLEVYRYLSGLIDGIEYAQIKR